MFSTPLSTRRERLKSRIAQFELSVRRHEHFDTVGLATDVLQILRTVIELADSSDTIKKDLRATCARLQASVPPVSIVANVCTRVLAILCEELDKSLKSYDVHRSQSLGILDRFMTSSPVARSPSGPLATMALRQPLLEGIEDVFDEVQSQQECIAKYAKQYIHDGDLLMTLGYSESVFKFFAKVADRRNFGVLVPEHAPLYDGLLMSRKLREVGVDCRTIPDSAVFAMMPRVTTVFVSVRAVLADGTLIATSFMRSMGMAARHHGKPFVILYSKAKLVDRFLKPRDSFTVLDGATGVAPLEDAIQKYAVVLNPDGEIVSGQFATVLINENGPHDPADVFPLVQSLYHLL
jgi:translation initiation factor eIF-2B subunit beta